MAPSSEPPTTPPSDPPPQRQTTHPQRIQKKTVGGNGGARHRYVAAVGRQEAKLRTIAQLESDGGEIPGVRIRRPSGHHEPGATLLRPQQPPTERPTLSSEQQQQQQQHPAPEAASRRNSAPERPRSLTATADPAATASTPCTSIPESPIYIPQYPASNPPSSSSSSQPAWPPKVHCRCGIPHSGASECLEQQTFMILYKTHAAFPRSAVAASRLPRNPALPGLALNAHGDNSVSLLVASILRTYRLKNVETLFGCYFFGYRLLRWRLYPDEHIGHDTPAWLLPTEIQNTHPHPVCIDFLPWPGLRDYLCQHKYWDSRHCVKLYMESLCLTCPQGSSLVTLEGGQVVMSKEFEDIASDLANWSLGAPFSETFPQLMHFVQP